MLNAVLSEVMAADMKRVGRAVFLTAGFEARYVRMGELLRARSRLHHISLTLK